MHFSLVQLWTKEEDMMRCMIFLAVFLSTSAGADRAEFTLGGVEGNAWQVPLAQEREGGGFYALFDAAGQRVETVEIGTSPQWWTPAGT